MNNDNEDTNNFNVSDEDKARWNKILDELDNKLQFGLLERLRRVQTYHFQGSSLTLVVTNTVDLEYFQKTGVNTQLIVFAQDAAGVKEVLINSES